MPENLCEALADASRGWTGDTPSGAMLTATRAFLARAADDNALLGEAAASLGSYEPGAAAWIAVASGTVVEQGAPADLAGPAIFEVLRSWLPKLPLPDKGPETWPEPTGEQATLLVLFRYLCQSAVTHLARLPAQRGLLGQDGPLLDRLGELQGYSHGAIWLREALLKSSGVLVFLHPPSETGLRMIYSNVSNCFHLFSLLQTAIGTLVPGGREPSAAIARVARGKSSGAVSDEAWWHFGNASSTRPEITTSIWGEGLVREIPSVDGLPVVVAWPQILEARTWDGGFLGPHIEAMPADAMIERALTADETRAWLEKLGIGAKKKWWRLGR